MKKVVVTGMGMISALGLNVEENWDNLIRGKSGVTKITDFDVSSLDTKIAAKVNDEVEEIADLKIHKKMRKQMTRITKIGVLAAMEAVENANIKNSTIDSARAGVIMGVITAGYNDIEKEKSGSNYIVKTMPNALNAWISILTNFKGPSFSVSTACASSAYAISLGMRMIREGSMDVVIVGGADNSIEPNYIAGFNQILAMSANNDSPGTASRPFSKSRDGFIMGEGAGMLVLESEEHARKRNAEIYGEIAGSAITCDAYHITAPGKDGEAMAHCIDLALKDSQVEPGDIDYINAHGTSTYLNDYYETLAIKRVFKDHAKKMCISSSKSMIGHTIAAAGAIEGIITILTLKNGLITPTINYGDPDPELDLNYTPNEAVFRKVNTALSNSFGFGGHNGTIVYRKSSYDKLEGEEIE